MRLLRERRTPTTLVFLALLPAGAAAQTPPSDGPVRLEPGRSVDGLLAPGAVHSYAITAARGDYLRAELDRFPDAFHFRVYDPAGVQLADAWVSCQPDESTCVVPFFAEITGLHLIEARAPAPEVSGCGADCADARYRLRLHLLAHDEAAAERDRLQAALTWLGDSARPLRALAAGSGFEDLRPLAHILGDARVVGVGEATHGTREFFQVKHRLLEFLVREKGFTHFAIEMDQGAARAIDEFVLGGEGDAGAVLAAQGMWQWDTEEVAALVSWMRDYNRTAAGERKVRFVGFDFQVNDRGRQDVLAYLRRVAADRVAGADSIIAPLVRRPNPDARTFVEFYTLSPERKAATARAVRELFDFLAANRVEFIRRSSAEEYETALQAARRLVQFTDAHSRPGYSHADANSGVATRDRYMAENISRILEEAGAEARVMVWSHNEHVRRDGYTMGYYLGEQYGSRYYAIGLAFDRGGFRALEITGVTPAPLKEFTFGPAFQSSVGWYLRRAEAGNSFVDFRAAPAAGSAAEWLATPRAMRSIGNGYAPTNPSGYYRPPVVLGTSFDVLVFIEETTPARAP